MRQGEWCIIILCLVFHVHWKLKNLKTFPKNLGFFQHWLNLIRYLVSPTELLCIISILTLQHRYASSDYKVMIVIKTLA